MPKSKSSAFMKPMIPSSDLAAIVGSKPLPRTEVTRKLWAYIKRNGLQDKVHRRIINPDEKLAAVLGTRPIDMFKMTKKVSGHLS